MKKLLKLVRDESGQDLIEYALMVGFVAVAAGAIVPAVSEFVATKFFSPESAPMMRIVCAALAAVFLGIIVLRRRKTEEE